MPFAVSNLKWKVLQFCLLVQTSYLEKFCFTSYRAKCSHPIRLQDSLIINISGKNTMVSSVPNLEYILIILDRWKRHFREKNYIENYFYLLKSTKTTSQKCWRNIIWADFFWRPYRANGIKTRLGSPVIFDFLAWRYSPGKGIMWLGMSRHAQPPPNLLRLATSVFG